MVVRKRRGESHFLLPRRRLAGGKRKHLLKGRRKRGAEREEPSCSLEKKKRQMTI